MPPVSLSDIPVILDRFLHQKFPGVTIFYQGVQGTPPPKKLWMRSTCKTGEQIDLEKGMEGYSQRVGVYLIDISAPHPKSSKDAWKLAEQVENAFRRENIQGVQIEDPKSENMGIDSNNNSFRVRVNVPWWCWSGKISPSEP